MFSMLEQLVAATGRTDVVPYREPPQMPARQKQPIKYGSAAYAILSLLEDGEGRPYDVVAHALSLDVNTVNLAFARLVKAEHLAVVGKAPTVSKPKHVYQITPRGRDVLRAVRHYQKIWDTYREAVSAS